MQEYLGQHAKWAASHPDRNADVSGPRTSTVAHVEDDFLLVGTDKIGDSDDEGMLTEEIPPVQFRQQHQAGAAASNNKVSAADRFRMMLQSRGVEERHHDALEALFGPESSTDGQSDDDDIECDDSCEGDGK